jgi:hypothetical protein
MKIYYLILLLTFLLSPFYIPFFLPKGKHVAKLYGSKKEGYMNMQIQDNCPFSGFYVFQNEIDVFGRLTLLNCSSSINDDQIEYKFANHGGFKMTKNCHGKMTKIESPQKIVTIWKFEGSLSEPPCLNMGKPLIVEMDKASSITF